MDSRWDWILFTVPKVTRTKFGALPEVLGNRPYSERDSIIKCLKKKRRTTVRYLLSWADFLAKENTFHKYLTCSVEFCLSYHIWKWNVRVRVEIDGTLSQKHVCLRGQRHFKKRCLSRFFKVNILPSWKTGTVLVDRVFLLSWRTSAMLNDGGVHITLSVSIRDGDHITRSPFLCGSHRWDSLFS